MIDTFNIPNNFSQDVQIYNSPGGTSSQINFYQVWEKPKGASMVYFTVIGGGAGGGGGFTHTAGVQGGGGGGGGSSAFSRLLVPAFFLPDILYVSVGVGGAGGTANNNGSSGASSFVSLTISQTQPIAVNQLIVSGNSTAQPGQKGTTLVGGAGGTSVSGGSTQNATWASLGMLVFFNNAQGTAGGLANVAGTDQVAFSGGVACLMGGCGGGGSTSANTAGGGVTATGLFSALAGGAAAAAGLTGMQINYPVWGAYPGTGGGGNNTGTGGAGGVGGTGCGGGGGGCGTTGGAGGNGGNGIVIIVSW